MRLLSPILVLCAAALLAACETAAPGTPTDLVLSEAPRAGGESFDAGLMEPSPVVVADAAAPASAAPAGAGTGRVRAGVLTAGDIDDGLNLNAFMRFVSQARGTTGLPTANFAAPVLAQIVGPDGRPAAGVRVTLRLQGAAEPFYDGFSGVEGMVTVFPALHGAGRPGPFELRVFPQGASEPVSRTLPAGGARQVVQMPVGGTVAPDFLDLVFVVDTTGSMGDELEWLASDLTRIVGAARRGFSGVDIRYGLIVYRDLGDDYTVRTYPFTNSAPTMRAQLRAQSADGGGDYPEAAAAAMNAAMALDWRRGRGERLVFHIADAPPHDRDARAYLGAVQTAAQRNVQIFGLGASGVADEAEYLMRQAAVATGGRYLFLTDDSGVGLTHAEPTISCYQVTLLSDLMVRVLRSELLGQRIEPAPGDVIRSVGSYQNGVCLD